MKQLHHLEKVQFFTSEFFNRKVRILPQRILPKELRQTRINPYTEDTQEHTFSFLQDLALNCPDDALLCMAITLEDLYPDPEWNFVYGQAMLQHGIGVYSFYRLNPKFTGDTEVNQDSLYLLRTLKLVAHEAGHTFNLHHCIYYECLLNGVMHMQESDASKLNLCPVCLRKMNLSMQADLAERDKKIENFLRRWGLGENAKFFKQRRNHNGHSSTQESAQGVF